MNRHYSFYCRWQPFRRAIIGVAIGFVVCTPSLGDEATPQPGIAQRQVPAVVVSFEGGIVGDNMSLVLDILARQPGGLPTEIYVVKQGDYSVCTILAARGYPEPCTKLAASIDRLNPVSLPGSRGIKVGDAVLLPKNSA